MSKTKTRTNTYAYAFTQTEVVLIQYEKAIDYAGVLSEDRADLLSNAIRDKQISEVGIYAYNKEHKRVAEITLAIDWDKHQRIIKTFGDVFDEGLDGFLYSTGEAVETTKVLDLKKWAEEEGLNLSIWIRTAKAITGNERENLLNKIGFNGGPPEPWSGEIIVDTSTEFRAIPQMTLGYKASGV